MRQQAAPSSGMDDITCVMLVGGKSRRMGKDKTFLCINGKPIFEHLLDVFRTTFSRIVLVGDREERFAGYRLPVLPDIYTGSALGGLYSALSHAESDYIFVSSCDIPFPNPAIIRYLCSLKEGFDVVVPATGHGYEPLFALYSRNCLEPIKSLLENGECCVYAFYPEVRLREVSNEEIARFDPEGKAFVNVNTPAEFAALGGIL